VRNTVGRGLASNTVVLLQRTKRNRRVTASQVIRDTDARRSGRATAQPMDPSLCYASCAPTLFALRLNSPRQLRTLKGEMAAIKTNENAEQNEQPLQHFQF